MATHSSTRAGESAAYEVLQIAKSYNGRYALAPMSIEISPGEKIAIVGPSGSGKTTLLHILSGVTRPDSGDVLLKGNSLSDLGPGKKLSKLVGVIHQQYDLVPQLSVLHNVLAGRLGQWSTLRSLASLVWPQERNAALQALERVGIAEKSGERTSHLSGGEQQRVAIARLLLQDPEIIVADEPVSSLDPARADDLMGMLAGIADDSGKTLIAGMHSIELARAYFDRIIGLRNGESQFDLPIDWLTEVMLEELYELEGLQDESSDRQ